MDNKEMIKKQLTDIINDVKYHSNEVQKLADMYNISVDIYSDRDQNTMIASKYPLLKLQYSVNVNEGIDKIADQILDCQMNKEYYLFNKIRFSGINEKAKILKVREPRNFYLFNLFGIEEKETFTLIKKYENGNFDYLVNNPKVFDLLNFTNETTKRIIAAITPEVKEENARNRKKPSYNIHSVIHFISKGMNLSNWEHANHYLIEKYLNTK